MLINLRYDLVICLGNAKDTLNVPIQGSTYGMSSCQILEKHKFLQPSWLQPLAVELYPKNLETSRAIEQVGISEARSSSCNSSYNTEELSRSQQDHKRYKLDTDLDWMSNPPKLALSSLENYNRTTKFDSRSPQSIFMSSRSSLSDTLFIDNKLGAYRQPISSLNKTKSTECWSTIAPSENLEPSKHEIHKKQRNNIEYNANCFWQNTGHHDKKTTEYFSNFLRKPYPITLDTSTPLVSDFWPRLNSITSQRKPEGEPPPLVPYINRNRIEKSELLDPLGQSSFSQIRNSINPNNQFTTNNAVSSQSTDASPHRIETTSFANNTRHLPLNGAKAYQLMKVASHHLLDCKKDKDPISFSPYFKQIENMEEPQKENKRIGTLTNQTPYFSDIDTNHEEDVRHEYSQNTISLIPNKECYQTEESYEEGKDHHRPPSNVACEDSYPGSTSHKNSSSTFDKDSTTVTSCEQYKEFANHDREKTLEKIDRIFESFVPVMQITDINKTFVLSLISLHRRKPSEEKYANNFSLKAHLLKFSIEADHESNGKTVHKHSLKGLLDHFHSFQASFVKFARSNEVFKNLYENDQTELLRRNSNLFVQVILGIC